MAMDAMEASYSPQSQTQNQFGQTRHFYLAVDRVQFKMETLVDLLGVAGQRLCLPMVVCCSSRDELDAVCLSVSNLPFIFLSSLHSDLGESERLLVLEKFRQATLRFKQIVDSQEHEDEVENDEHRSHMIVVTDACLPLLSSGESLLSSHLLINYELPSKKETYMRRVATCLAADGIVINMVVGGEVVTLKSIEESINVIIPEMPINVSEIL